MSEEKHHYYQIPGWGCITDRLYIAKLPNSIRRISGKEYKALIKIINKDGGNNVKQ